MRQVVEQVDAPAHAVVRALLAQERIEPATATRFTLGVHRARRALLAAWADLDEHARADLRQALVLDYHRAVRDLLADLDPGDVPRLPRAPEPARVALETHPGLRAWLRSVLEATLGDPVPHQRTHHPGTEPA
ncbi:hypothetical protein BJP25_10995 [Actinokineospora bangkokensis]|uniref:Uncharacterized protein n=1 Tax=Actinokineospora bangkokensis TaxID=1193682 RepID=A0A1Q9LQJ4_9PSEU|nr:hypothetical protein BJP25_10995 [Actinokineospora bangkokensis]